MPLPDLTKRGWWFILPNKPRDRHVLGHMVRDLDHLDDMFNASPEDPSSDFIESEQHLWSRTNPMQWNSPAHNGYFNAFKATVENYRDFNNMEVTTYNPTQRYVTDFVECAFFRPEERRNSPPMFMITGVSIARYLVPIEEPSQNGSSPSSSVTLGREDDPVIDQDFTWAVRLVKVHVSQDPPMIESDWRSQPQRVKYDCFPMGQRAAFPGVSAILDCKETLVAHGFHLPQVMKESAYPRDLFIALDSWEKQEAEEIVDVEMPDA
ncbi:hypothetical protein QBC44DRAFT_332273 [Cladorrhinum sp. PSN332]|nr:hypothetical protein QBC44DRAFT_332273 [Cladorrhinum sp. PSN332]